MDGEEAAGEMGPRGVGGVGNTCEQVGEDARGQKTRGRGVAPWDMGQVG